jgi:aryl-alcohol dehydrogenase-like predicted oxidoreductase
VNWILGTANFGTKYGIANGNLELNSVAVKSILDSAAKLGIKYLDTAPNYGESEVLIGEAGVDSRTFSIMTKTKVTSEVGIGKSSVFTSLNRLHCKKIHTVFIHNSSQLPELNKSRVDEEISAILESGTTEFIGASVYDEREIEYIYSNFPKVTAFQVPENILDQRLLNSKLVHSLAESGVKFYVRSILLQGLITLESGKLPPKFDGISHAIKQIEQIARLRGLTVLELSLSYLNLLSWSSGFLVGTASSKQLESLISSYQDFETPSQLPDPLPVEIVDPRRWSHDS